MKESANKLKIFLYSMIGLTLLCVLLFTISMFVAFDADVGYFSSTNVLPYIQSALATVSIFAFGSVIFLFPKNSLPVSNPSNTRLASFTSLLCGFVFIGGMIITFFSTSQSASNLNQFQRYIFSIITVSGLIASVYFIYDALTPSESGLTLKIISAIFGIIYFLCSIIFEHVDLFVPINAPRKTLLFLSFISASMFIVQKLRFKSDIGQPRAYVFFGSTSTLLCATLSIPGLVAHYAGVFKDSSFLVYYLIALAFAVYSFANLLTYMKHINEQEV